MKESFKINRALSKPLTALFLKTPLTPNQVTLLSLLFGILSGLFLSKGSYTASVVGALCFQMACVLDNCDGEIARAKNLRSVFGGWLDIAADVLTELAFFSGLTFGILNQGVEGPVILFGGLCIAGSMINFSVVILEKIKGFGPAVYNRPNPEGIQRESVIFKIVDAIREGDSSWFVMLFVIVGKAEYLLWFGGIYMQSLWISAVFLNFKWLFTPSGPKIFK